MSELRLRYKELIQSWRRTPQSLNDLAAFTEEIIDRLEMLERKQHEGPASVGLLEDILESVDLAVLALDAGEKVTYVNTRFRGLFGCDPQAGQSYETIEPEKTRKVLRDLLAEVWAGGGTPDIVFPWGPGGNEETSVAARAMLIRDALGEIAGALFLFRDTTESGPLVDSRRLEEMKANFAATAAHELRTPLASMIAAVSLFRHGMGGEVTEQQARLLDVLYRNADRLKMLVNDIVDLVLLESGVRPLRPSRIPVGGLCRKALSNAEKIAREKGLEIELAGSPDGEIYADSERIHQVLSHLLGNAVKFTPPGGKVRICALWKSEELVISVEDTGTGIPKDQLERIFAKFYQVEDAMSRASPGTGLGLSICRQIVNIHGGRIWAESEAGKGSRFAFTIPRKLPLFPEG